MNAINGGIAQLLNDNRQFFGGQSIAFDGVVDEETYNKTEIKTIFLLKEVNDPRMSKDWTDFMEHTKTQASKESVYKTWPNVCLWIETLRNPNVDAILKTEPGKEHRHEKKYPLCNIPCRLAGFADSVRKCAVNRNADR